MDHEQYMIAALEEARLALSHDDVPIGAVCVLNGSIISAGHNEKERRNDATCHAEMVALQTAMNALSSKYLTDVTIYSTLEPCVMCAGAIVMARCKRLVFGAFDPKGGAAGSLYNLCCDPRLNFELDVVSGVLEAESSTLLKAFFQTKR